MLNSLPQQWPFDGHDVCQSDIVIRIKTIAIKEELCYSENVKK